LVLVVLELQTAAETLDQTRYLETLHPLVVVVVEKPSTRQARVVDLVVEASTEYPLVDKEHLAKALAVETVGETLTRLLAVVVVVVVLVQLAATELLKLAAREEAVSLLQLPVRL
jgi:hypothetical protein